MTSTRIAGADTGATGRQRTLAGDTAAAMPGDKPIPGQARKIGTEPVNGVSNANARQPNHDTALAAMVRTKQEAFDKAKKELDDAKALAAK